MANNNIANDFYEAQQFLADFIANKQNFVQIEKAGMLMVNAIKSGHKILSCGNGGSMSDAMHFAEELTGRFRADRKPIAAISVSDASHITCTANDYGFESIFSRYIGALGQPGDVLLAISTSGNSANIVKAAEEALGQKMTVVALSGKDGGKLAKLANIEIRAPYSDFSDRVQEIHIKIIHALIRFIEDNLNG